MVRNANAHAWCEIFDDASGSWIRFDPTPGQQQLADANTDPSAAGAAAAQRDRGWRAWRESLRIFWYRRIVDFDLDTQEQLLTSTRNFFREARDLTVEWADDKALALRNWLRRPWDLRRWAGIGSAAVVLVGLIWVWRRHGLRWWFRLNRPRRRNEFDPVRREASRWLGRGARRANFKWPEPVRADLLRLRFGPPGSWPDPVTVFRAARQALRQT